MVRPAHPTGVGREGSGVRGPRRPRRGPGSSLRSAHQPAISEVFLRDYESGSASAPCFAVVTGSGGSLRCHASRLTQRQQSPQLAVRGRTVHIRRIASTGHGRALTLPGARAVTVIACGEVTGRSTPEMLWAASNEGVIAARELVRLGVPEGTTYRRCRDGGPWQRSAPASSLCTTASRPPPAPIAGLLHAGHDAVITGRSALRLHGLRQRPRADRVHLLSRSTQQVRSCRGSSHVERTARMPRACSGTGLAVAPLCRRRPRRGPPALRTRGRSRRASPNRSSAGC